MDDGSETRLDKLYSIIEQSRFGIHDLSRTELDGDHGLPRFNMPLELGIFLGAKRFGGEAQKRKRALVMDVERYRYQKFVSDLAGIDPQPHAGDPRTMVLRARNWLATVSGRSTTPSPAAILDSYDRFVTGLPDIAHGAGLTLLDMPYPDLERITLAWTKAEQRTGALAP